MCELTVRLRAWCAKRRNSYYYPGTFQQYALAPANYATPIPDGVPSDLAAPLLCGGVTVYSALKKLIDEGVRPGDWVVIPGMVSFHMVGYYVVNCRR